MKQSSEFRYKPQCRVLEVLDTKVYYQAVPVLYWIIGLSPDEKCPYQLKHLSTERNFQFSYQFNSKILTLICGQPKPLERGEG